MRTRVYLDGRIVPPEEAFVPALDPAFLLGDSIFEVLWWHRGVPIQWADHLDRLENSARLLLYRDLVSRRRILEAVTRTVEAAEVEPDTDAWVRIVLTRGGTPPLALPAPARSAALLVVVAPASRPGPEEFSRGVRVVIAKRRRTAPDALDPAAKSSNYLNCVLALLEARREGAQDAILLGPHGKVCEATTSNVFLVAESGVWTPPLAAGLLPGTVRKRLLSLAPRQGLDVGERWITIEDLRAAREIFLTSSVRGIMPVTALDGEEVGSGRSGPVAGRFRDLLEEAADREVAPWAAQAPAT